MEFLGVKVGNGLALGKVVFLDNEIPSNLPKKITTDLVDFELIKIDNAIKEVLEDYNHIILETEYEDIKELSNFYKMLLSSNSLKEELHSLVKDDYYTATSSVQIVFEKKANELSKLDNVYISERSNDIVDVQNKVLRKILKIKDFDLSTLKEDSILVAKEITPSILLSKHLEKVKGIISEIGGKTSHVAILATNMGIPSVFGIKDVQNVFKENELIFVNGNKGIVSTELTEPDINNFKELIKKEKMMLQDLQVMYGRDAITLDNKRFEVTANAGDITDLDNIDPKNIDGIGLFRSEFLYLNRKVEPTEELLFNSYKAFAEKLNGKTLIIRTLDIGGDKVSSYINIGKEDNPFLGYRAIRYCLDNPEFFKTSLRAILRASAFGNIAIMYPMISSLEEVLKANQLLSEAKLELDQKNISYDSNIKVGIMIEIPAVAVIAPLLITEVDFFSIGTNDLIQYSIAVDRGNSKVSDLYNYFNPGVIHLINNTIKASKPYEDKFTGMCGEMAADPLAIILLVGLGLNEFSVNISSILKTKKLISLLNYDDCKKVSDHILTLKSASEIHAYLDNYARTVYDKYY